jgi:hypothetical protein
VARLSSLAARLSAFFIAACISSLLALALAESAPLPLFFDVFLVLVVALAFFPAEEEALELELEPELELELDPELLLPELKAPILAPLKSTLLVLLIRVPRFAAIRLPLERVFSSAADIVD